MSYVSAIARKEKDQIEVVERVDGKRIYQTFPMDYSFFVSDPKGKYQTIYRTPVSKITPKTSKEFYKELKSCSNKQIWESDLNFTFKCLSQHYRNVKPPELHVVKLDIEVDFSPERGYSDPSDPFNMITSITLHMNWLNKMVTLAVPPKGLSWESASNIASKFSDTYIYKTEVEMLNDFLDLIEDSDLITGWNSGGFDLPYLINRISLVMGKEEVRRFCLWNEKPVSRVFEKYGKEQKTYDLVGRIHMDYMDIYRKFTYEERHSYSLNAISEYELDKHKITYEGSLDKLYNEDFEKFIDYNRQDVQLLVELDEKLKLIALINELSHSTTTLIPNTLGQVAMTDQAIINRAHDMDLIVPNKNFSFDGEEHEEDDESIAGAHVAHPKKGMQDWVGVIDINSLYPSTIRALNMGLETIVGQLRPILTDQYLADKMKIKNMTLPKAWESVFGCLEYQSVIKQEAGTELIIDWNDGREDKGSAADIYKMIFESGQKWMLSANGTIFRYDIKSVFATLLGEWYSDRKVLQGKKAEALESNRIEESEYYDRLQHVSKIKLNAAYGSAINRGSRFSDKRIGQSTTLSGRVVVRHMNAFINASITGEYNHEGLAIKYLDTDSSNFSAWETIKNDVLAGNMEWNRDICIEVYQALADKVNDSWLTFMERAFHCPPENGKIIRGGLESIGEKALYITKKRYAILNYYKDGKRYDDKPKLKAMGLDLRRSDTPVICQKFLKDILMDLLKGNTIDSIIAKINDFKTTFGNLPVYEKGTPKRVNKLTYYGELIKRGQGNRVPGHVRASINYNALRGLNHDNYSMSITDGMKVIVCKLKDNPIGYTSVAYPIDETRLPKWFMDLPFDSAAMEEAVVDKKIENLLDELEEWEYIKNSTVKANTFNDFFSLG